jgi:hypothetical protein
MNPLPTAWPLRRHLPQRLVPHRRAALLLLALGLLSTGAVPLAAAELRAGAAKVDISDYAAGPVHDPCYVKALVFQQADTTAVLITVDAVAIGEIGRIGHGYLPTVRAQLEQRFQIAPEHVIVNASHCHGVVRGDTDRLTVQAVEAAMARLQPVRVGTGSTNENRISENRRLRLKDGSQADMRRAYALPRDEDVLAVGPIDPQVGLLRIDRLDGQPLAVVYNFACHPIMNPPSVGSSADFPGYASQVIEEGLGDDVLALFIQGCGGDINPLRYKDVSRLPSAEPYGNLLGLTVLRAVRKMATAEHARLKVTHAILPVPPGADLETRIDTIRQEQTRLLNSLRPTNINFKTFLPLLLQHKLFPDAPAYYSQAYLHDAAQGREEFPKQDADNRSAVEAYLQNIDAMEQLTRLNTNLALLEMHREQLQRGAPSLDTELCGLAVGDFRLVTFPGELTVQVGLNIKAAAGPQSAFVAGYTNGYIYYTPTADERRNTGYAQEDCDSLVAPEWQALFEARALEQLRELAR